MGNRAKCALAFVGLSLIAAGPSGDLGSEATPTQTLRTLYAINQGAVERGSISVYGIDTGHRLIKSLKPLSNVGDVKGVVASASTGKLYVTYRDVSGIGRIYCMNIHDDSTVWDRVVAPGVDRLAISPDGRLLYVPTWEGGSANFINIVDANTGDIVRRLYFSSHSHDTQYPLSGPIFQETKADDGSGKYLYLIDPRSYAVSRVGPFSGILGPYAIDATSTYAVINVSDLWGMQVANLKTGQITTATIPDHPSGDAGLLHGIGWTPDESEVWESGRDSQVYIWDMSHNPMVPRLKEILTLHSAGPHWLTFTIKGDYGYVAPAKDSRSETEIFNVRTHKFVGVIESSEEMIEIDFVNGRVSQVGDQFGVGRARR